MQARVKEFCQKFGVEIAAFPTIPAKQELELRRDLINEEIGEFEEAARDRDLVGIADAIADSLYVQIQASLVLGFNFLVAPYALDPGTRPTVPDPEILDRRILSLDKLASKFAAACESRDQFYLGGSLMMLIDSTLEAAVECGIEIEPVFAEVHRSNMSKVWEDGSIQRRDDGKILKPPTYSPADVSGVLAKQILQGN